MFTARKSACLLALLTLVASAAPGCDTRPEQPAPQPQPAPEPEPEPSAWRIVDESPQLALPEDFDDEVMRAAIVKARQTASDARMRWLDAPPEDLARWAIKWAAPTIESGVEHVWVVPVNWSPFRIEGHLANPPQRELECGKSLNDLVSFPIEQLVDWVHTIPRAEEPEAREGGYTIKVLEARYGSAPLADDTGH